ncbi:hypothetical protein [Roseimicrobium sp. ORNL1]|uniref:hypothetical protein n=1 Tax=Roseimicrobium sp. ORNL1 TaxID=2711231 RepID=UPI0013E206CD|nr:hypothetical protein [Roseimicrobium sp. ORNL1]QIF04376.1 hypothetical protein G5S37_23575 [Roseimicrobium sp. ORNL1]
MKLRHLLACLSLLVGIASLAAVAYITWRNIAHGDGMILWLYLILLLAGIPLTITWWKDLVATEWAVIVAFILASSLVFTGFVMHDGFMEHGDAWHAFKADKIRPQVSAMTTEEYFKNLPPPQPIWPKVSAYFLFFFWGPAFVIFIYKGSLFCLRSLRRRPPAIISQ